MKTIEKARTALYGATVIAYEKATFESLLVPKSDGGGLDIKTIAISVVNYVLFFLGLIAIAFIVYGGILYVTSGGNEEKTTKARNTLLYAVIGIIVISLAFAILRWAQGVNPEDLQNTAYLFSTLA